MLLRHRVWYLHNVKQHRLAKSLSSDWVYGKRHRRVFQNIADDIQLFAPEQHHVVNYSDVCKNAHKTLADIKAKFPELIEKNEIKNSDIPKSFQPSKPDYSGIIEPEEIEKIKNFFTNDHKKPKLMLDG